MEQKKLTPAEIKSVQRTFEMITPLADTFALIFYDRFFQLEPTIRPLFKNDMTLQREKLMIMLAFIVRGLDRPDLFISELQEMGNRHVSYGVLPDHYPILKDAVLIALDVSLGEKMTDEIRVAWEKTLLIITDIMLTGAT